MGPVNVASLDTTSQQFVIQNLTVGTHYICPDPNFQWKRKTVVISVPTSSLPAGYQVKLVIPKEAEMQSDFRDLRFAYYDSVNLAWYSPPYWIESIDSGWNAEKLEDIGKKLGIHIEKCVIGKVEHVDHVVKINK